MTPDAIAVCCREWPITTQARLGRCGDCGERPKIIRELDENGMVREAQLWVHGLPARSFEQVANFLTGNDHDRSKVQVLLDGGFYDTSVDYKGHDVAQFWVGGKPASDYEHIARHLRAQDLWTDVYCEDRFYKLVL